MKLQQRTIIILIAAIIISLAGLVALQFVLITNAIELKQQAFRQNVNAAMNAVVQKLEAGETVGNVFRVAVKEPQSTFNMHMFSVRNDSMISLSVTGNGADAYSNRIYVSDSLVQMDGLPFGHPPIRWQGEKMCYTLMTPQHVLIRALNQVTGKDTIVVNRFEAAGEHAIDMHDNAFRQGEFIFKFLSDSATYTMQVQNGNARTVTTDKASFKRREALVGRVVDKLFLGESIPIEKRLRQAALDSVIGSNLKRSGIDLPFAFGVISERNDSPRIVQPASYAREVQKSEFKARLFPNDVLVSFNQLALYFPGQEVFILKQIGPLLALTILFMGIIVYCFTYTIRTMLRQKEFSVRLIDFINNMTHEFKTPISTISVAAETMLHPHVIADEEKIRRYGAVIQDENLRMRNQVDKILQMAVLEEGTYSLKCTPTDIHEIIAKAVENTALQVESKSGKVTYNLQAEHSMINADAVHITNVINNILDNAAKYSPEQPEIIVGTENKGASIDISISDNGIGISEEDQARVFEKYYRVHTGNVHNVKGFGLGLSYVKLITEAHGGGITLKSSPGNGTTVTLSFPVIQSKNIQ